MYCDFFGFKQEPFTIAPDPSFLYPSAKHRQALAHLKYGLDREGGFILFTGEVGTGKTTLTRLLLEQVPAAFRVAYVLNAKLDTRDVLASICDELHIDLTDKGDVSELSPKSYIDAINANLLETHSQGFKTLVVIEEAQNLDEEVLEMLRLLTNLETNTTKLLHILLVGQPELLDLIGLPQLRQLNQRVVSRFHLLPLNRSETESYLKHRMRKVGCSRIVFERSAIDSLHRFSEGVPRKLNLLAERALLGAYSQDRERVSKSQVVQAEKEVFGEKIGAKPRKKFTSVAIALLILASLIAVVSTRPEIREFWPAIPDSRTGMLVNSDEQQSTEFPDAVIVQQDESEGEQEPEEQAGVQQLILSPIQEATTELEAELILRSPSPLAGLLSLWVIDTEVADLAQLCIAAANTNLRCEEIGIPSAAEIESINRPALISLMAEPSAEENIEPSAEENLEPQYYLVESLSDFEFEISRGDVDLRLSSVELEDRIVGSAFYLWKPPLGFSDSVRLGDSNWAVLNWLQPRLSEIDPELSQLITGGRYSQPIRDGVAEFQRRYGLDADGVLGQRTLMKFNELDLTVPTLATEAR